MSGKESEHRVSSPEKLLGASFQCKCGRVHSVPVRKIVLEEGAYRRLPEVLEELSLPRNVCVVADDNTLEVLGRKVVRVLSEADYGVREMVLRSPSGGNVRADEATANELVSSLPSVSLLIAVGSGTISDLTKLAASRKGIPYVVVPTAPSMNGYTSSIVALTVSGLKTTLEANPPVAVIGDMDVLVESPMELIVSGFGDLVSKPISTADWKLAEIVEGGYFCYLPVELVEELERRYMKNAAGFRARNPGAIRSLMEGLLYSGISMVIAGSSSPASGGEHLISHTLDMQADLAGRPHGYHGSQVGVATVFTAALYEKVMEEETASFDQEGLFARNGEPEGELSALTGYWGSLAAAVGKELSFKLLGGGGKRERVIAIREKWDEIRREIAGFLRPWHEIRDALERAGAPTRISDIGVSLDQFRGAALHAREIRRRYTVLDLANDLGLFERDFDRIIRETGLWTE
ncbi:sn-glycerol-1-phosphate dehydrogenase [bacterium]|nr:sn-glycerol-1-phosphate dehydrogenase [bacterium]